MDASKRKLVDDDFSIIDHNHSIATPSTNNKHINIGPLV